MKIPLSVFCMATLAAVCFWSVSAMNEVSSSVPILPMAVTSTPGAVTPTPLPTEFLTATPTPRPTATPIPTATATATPLPPSAPSVIQPTILPALGYGLLVTPYPGQVSPVTRLIIPLLQLDSPVQFVPYRQGEWDISNLGALPGWLENTSRPELAGNTVLAGHLDLHYAYGPFENLAQLQPGDPVIVYTVQGSFQYRVLHVQSVADRDVSIAQPSILPRLTLLTCDKNSWDPAARLYTRRLVVIAGLENFNLE